MQFAHLLASECTELYSFQPFTGYSNAYDIPFTSYGVKLSLRTSTRSLNLRGGGGGGGVQSQIAENLEIGNAHRHKISGFGGSLVSYCCGEKHFDPSYPYSKQEEKTL